MKRFFIALLTVVAAALPIFFRYLIYSTEAILTFEAFLLSDWMFFCITINVAIANILGAKDTLPKNLSWAFNSSSLLIGISGFVLALSMFIPKAFAQANMQALNITGIFLVVLTSILYIVILSKSKSEFYG